MKYFFRQIIVAAAGVWVGFGLLFGAMTLYFRPSLPQVGPNTVLHIPLRGTVLESAPRLFLSSLKDKNSGIIDLVVFQKAIKHACKDPNIQGIYLEVDTLKAGWGKLEEMRKALLEFKNTGKFIVAYGKNYSQKAYYLTSIADEIVMHPAGIFLFQGLNQTVFFYKNLLDKLAIKPQIFRVGQYKSAIEPFIRQSMSQASRQQSTVLLHSIHSHFLHKIAAARKVEHASLQKMINNLSIVLPQDAKRAKLVNHIAHFDHAETLMNNKLKQKEKQAITYCRYHTYAAAATPQKISSNKIAVLVAEGPIVDGKGDWGTINTENLVADLRAVREDDTIKAVVLRINSPGGSALASDVLWQEIMLTKAQKPVVASLSDIAASGGYYMATACNQIVAHPTTITGSIGIFGLFFDVNVLLNKTLGITTDVVKTNKSSDLFSNPGRPLRAYEKTVVQRVIDHGYNTFLERVAAGRGLNKASVARLAAGRVWSGQAAQKKGLLDKLGSIEEAIQIAAQLGNVSQDYAVVHWAHAPTLYSELRSYLKQETVGKSVMNILKEQLPALQSLQVLTEMRGVQARLPYTIEID